MTVTNNLNINDDGIQDFTSTTGDFAATDLTDKGDLLATTGSAYQRFPVGTDGYVLKADSSQTVGWRWACTNFEYLQMQTASSDTSVEFTSFADSECFAGYKLIWRDVELDGEDFGLAIRFSIDNGSSWITSNYQYVRESIRDDTADTVYPNSASDSEIEINSLTGGPETMYHFGEGFVYPRVSSTGLMNMWTASSVNQGSDLQFLTSRGFGCNPTTSEINGFQFLRTDGGTFSGEFYLYGVLEE